MSQQNRRFFNPQSIREYFVQVSLIIVSLFIATGVDRCNSAAKDEAKLQNYLLAIKKDMQEELTSDTLNLADCNKDIYSLERAIGLMRYDQDDSLGLALRHAFSVVARGVFRSFTPTTFDVMSNTGDVVLIKDLEFRNNLSEVFSFRTSYLQKDLEHYDQKVEETTAALGQYLDLSCLTQTAELTDCITDRAGLVGAPRNELMLLLRQAQIRGFHLEMAVRQLEASLEEIEEKIISP